MTWAQKPSAQKSVLNFDSFLGKRDLCGSAGAVHQPGGWLCLLCGMYCLKQNFFRATSGLGEHYHTAPVAAG